ncbi:uncharacterized protein LOC121889762 [Thunnus maccoyii]|uniref:uncharacterized protein LOC121889762 n=1 Tax=Thunnus maccoyii TaxID=8240 RepID=UPI001C4CFC5F|nr:uncharacterized protein LOC121889762 [Thunnus maccoyii]
MATSFNTVLFLSVCQLFSASADPEPQKKTTYLGGIVTLPCKAPNNITIVAVEWSRSDLQKYVFFQRDGHLITQDQDPSFVKRVELTNSEMKDGDLSLILKNVCGKDNGTYECRYVGIEGRRWKRADESKLISIIKLDIDQTTENTERGHLGIILPVFALIVLLAAVVGFVISKKPTGRFPVQSFGEADVHQQLQEKENSQSKTITLNISDIQV